MRYTYFHLPFPANNARQWHPHSSRLGLAYFITVVTVMVQF